MNLAGLLTVVVSGVSYGMLLFLFAVGLSITLGLMRFINLAHTAFAMCGGYLVVVLVRALDIPFLPALLLCFVGIGLLGMVFERVLIRHLYGRSDLKHVLFSIGLVFVAGAAANIAFGPQEQFMPLPGWITAPIDLFGLYTTGYNIFIIVAGCVVLASLLAVLRKSLFGARVRAAVDSRDTAESVGIHVPRLFAIAFGLGAALAGLGGALAVGQLGLSPSFALDYLVIVLIVVAVGGPGSVLGSFLAALLLGLVTTLSKYYVPEIGSFIIYVLLVLTMVFMPQGLLGKTS